MLAYDFDLFVLGAGSGGVRTARISGQHGARVAIAEGGPLGGTCVNVGCIPKKLMVYAGHFAHDFADAVGYGWEAAERIPAHDWGRLIANKDREIARLNGVYQRLLEGAGVEILTGWARFEDPHTIRVGDRRITAERIVIATGGVPVRPTEPGTTELGLVSDDVFTLKDRPQRVIVAGGGYIAVEFAGIFRALGSEVHHLYRDALFLRGFDDDVRLHLAQEMRDAGIDLRFSTIVERLERTHDCILAELSDGRMLEVDAVLYAIGRRPNVEGLNLAAAGVVTDARGAVPIDAAWRTNVPHIHAIGDVTDRINLTPVATAEGHALADTLFGNNPRSVDLENVPTAVFSDPPIGTVGLTEAQARQHCERVRVYRTTFRPLKNTLSGRGQRTLMKLVVDGRTDRVVGAHMVGPDAGEIIQGIAIAIKARATKAMFDQTIGIHPTAAEEFVTMRTAVPDPQPVAPMPLPAGAGAGS